MRITNIIIGIILMILLAPAINAESWACFNKGQKIDFCNPLTPDRVCGSDMGCQYCVAGYNSASKCYTQGNWPVCNTIPPKCSGDISPSVDKENPIMNITNPKESKIYSSRSVLLNIGVNEKGSLSYTDNLNGRGRWISLCTSCTKYIGNRNFKEGINNITIRATDLSGNIQEKIVTFFVDSKKPRISKTEPKIKFANGYFAVEYSEDNVKSVKLHYGNYTLKRTKELSCTSGQKQWCDINVDLSEFNNKIITYYFSVEDKSGNIVNSKQFQVMADSVAPQIKSLNYTINGRSVAFKISINESNPWNVIYYDYEDIVPKWKTLCSTLKNGICEVKKTFSYGAHELDIQVTDKALNSVSKKIIFHI